MSWDYFRYDATCLVCGHKGVCVKGSDDWNRSSTSWEGFKSKPADPQAIAKMKVDSRDQLPVCECGSTKIEIGSLIKAR